MNAVIKDYDYTLMAWQFFCLLFAIAIFYLLYKIYKKVK
ncbi:hypothetical protein NU08_3866 [Flavobacterium anhuiense]|uniref:Uncharacterized protein n=1 Tax=Flavobacterium anhuiense TaxID=459526 RepID=A0A444VTW2_9FLAO|nr:hypothetical protein NU08_3866 [Flavobacterium anhuiense]